MEAGNQFPDSGEDATANTSYLLNGSGMESSTPYRGRARNRRAAEISAWSDESGDQLSDVDRDSTEDDGDSRVNGGHPLLLSSVDLERLESIMSTASMRSTGRSHIDMIDNFEEADDGMKEFALQFARSIITESQRIINEGGDHELANGHANGFDNNFNYPVVDNSSLLDQIISQQEEMSDQTNKDIDNTADSSTPLANDNAIDIAVQMDRTVGSDSLDFLQDENKAPGINKNVTGAVEGIDGGDSLIDVSENRARGLAEGESPGSLIDESVEVDSSASTDLLGLEGEARTSSGAKTNTSEIVATDLSGLSDFDATTNIPDKNPFSIFSSDLTVATSDSADISSDLFGLEEQHNLADVSANINDVQLLAEDKESSPKAVFKPKPKEEPLSDISAGNFDNNFGDNLVGSFPAASESPTPEAPLMQEKESQETFGMHIDAEQVEVDATVAAERERAELEVDQKPFREEETLQSIDELKNESGLDLLPNLGDVPEDYKHAPNATEEEYISDFDGSISSENDVDTNIISDFGEESYDPLSGEAPRNDNFVELNESGMEKKGGATGADVLLTADPSFIVGQSKMGGTDDQPPMSALETPIRMMDESYTDPVGNSGVDAIGETTAIVDIPHVVETEQVNVGTVSGSTAEMTGSDESVTNTLAVESEYNLQLEAAENSDGQVLVESHWNSADASHVKTDLSDSYAKDQLHTEPESKENENLQADATNESSLKPADDKIADRSLDEPFLESEHLSSVTPVDSPHNESLNQSAGELIGVSLTGSVNGSPGNLVDESSVDGSVDEAVVEPLVNLNDEAVLELADRSYADPVNEPHFDSIAGPAIEPVEGPPHKSVDGSLHASAAMPHDELFGDSHAKPVDEPHVGSPVKSLAEAANKPLFESAAERHVDPADERHVDPADEPHVDLAAEPHVDPADEPHVNPADEPHVDSTAEPIIESVEAPLKPFDGPYFADAPQVESHVESTVEPHVESVVKSVDEPFSVSKIFMSHVEPVDDSHVKSVDVQQIEPVGESNVESIVDSLVEPVDVPVIASSSESHIKLVGESRVESLVEPHIDSADIPLVDPNTVSADGAPIVSAYVTQNQLFHSPDEQHVAPIFEPYVDSVSEPVIEQTGRSPDEPLIATADVPYVERSDQSDKPVDESHVEFIVEPKVDPFNETHIDLVAGPVIEPVEGPLVASTDGPHVQLSSEQLDTEPVDESHVESVVEPLVESSVVRHIEAVDESHLGSIGGPHNVSVSKSDDQAVVELGDESVHVPHFEFKDDSHISSAEVQKLESVDVPHVGLANEPQDETTGEVNVGTIEELIVEPDEGPLESAKKTQSELTDTAHVQLFGTSNAETVDELNAESAVELLVESANEPLIESTNEPLVASANEPLVEPTREPLVESANEPLVELANGPLIESAKEPLVESASEPLVESATEPPVESANEPLIESTNEPLVASANEPLVESTSEPLIEPANQSLVESANEPLVESANEPLVESANEPLAASGNEPLVESADEPLVKPTNEPLIESAKEPLVESASEPFVESATEPPVESANEPLIEAANDSVIALAKEPLIESANEPLVESASEPLVESTKEPLVESTTEPLVLSANEPLVESMGEQYVRAEKELIPDKEYVSDIDESISSENDVDRNIISDFGEDSLPTADQASHQTELSSQDIKDEIENGGPSTLLDAEANVIPEQLAETVSGNVIEPFTELVNEPETISESYLPVPDDPYHTQAAEESQTGDEMPKYYSAPPIDLQRGMPDGQLSLEEELRNAMMDEQSDKETPYVSTNDIEDAVEEPMDYVHVPNVNSAPSITDTVSDKSEVADNKLGSQTSSNLNEPVNLTIYHERLSDSNEPSQLQSWNSQEELTLENTSIEPVPKTQRNLSLNVVPAQLSDTSDNEETDKDEGMPVSISSHLPQQAVTSEDIQRLGTEGDGKDDQPAASSSLREDRSEFGSTDDGLVDKLDELNTPTIESKDLDLNDSLLDAIVDTPQVEEIPELTAQQEVAERRNVREVTIDGKTMTLDMTAIEPFRGVYTHGGFVDPEYKQAIIILTACEFPERSNPNYAALMDQLFVYVYHSVQQLVVDELTVVYLQGSAKSSQLPGLGWMKKCHDRMSRSMRKSIKRLFIVHPTFWTRAAIFWSKPFISSKFSRKVHQAHTLERLNKVLPLQNVNIPDRVRVYDANRKTK